MSSPMRDNHLFLAIDIPQLPYKMKYRGPRVDSTLVTLIHEWQERASGLLVTLLTD